MCILQFYWLVALYIFISLVRNASFLIRKTVVSGKKSVMSKNHCARTSCRWVRACAPHLLFVHLPDWHFFTSPTTPSTPRHMRGRKFPKLYIWQSPDKFTGKSKTRINVYVYIYIAHHLRGQWNSSISRKMFLALYLIHKLSLTLYAFYRASNKLIHRTIYPSINTSIVRSIHRSIHRLINPSIHRFIDS